MFLLIVRWQTSFTNATTFIFQSSILLGTLGFLCYLYHRRLVCDSNDRNACLSKSLQIQSDKWLGDVSDGGSQRLANIFPRGTIHWQTQAKRSEGSVIAYVGVDDRMRQAVNARAAKGIPIPLPQKSSGSRDESVGN